MTRALICIDVIEEIVGINGRLAGKGYRDFADRHGVLDALAGRQADIRKAGGRVIHVGLGFAPDYADHPAESPLLGGARLGGILRRGDPSTAFLGMVGPVGNDLVFTKTRISAFRGTGLEIALRSLGTLEIELAGVATDLAVQSAARDAHDMDFVVTVVAGDVTPVSHPVVTRVLG
jgi:nicotinamidase-related amidase